jgi:hypothetical protein
MSDAKTAKKPDNFVPLSPYLDINKLRQIFEQSEIEYESALAHNYKMLTSKERADSRFQRLC